VTTFNEIYDFSLVTIRDYKLDKIYTISITDFENVMLGYMLKAIPNFSDCQKDLENILDIPNKTFTELLTLTEQVILSNLLVIEWMNSKILDVTQLQLHLNDTDFRHYSEAQNLKAKMDAKEVLREINSQAIVDYGLKNAPWSEWASGNYGNYA